MNDFNSIMTKIIEIDQRMQGENELTEVQGQLYFNEVNCLTEAIVTVSNISNIEEAFLNNLNHLINYLDSLFHYEFNKIENNSIFSWKKEASNRLKMMFIKHLNEVIYLLTGGYPIAAMARLRVVFEISVFFKLIIKHDEDLAEKFLKHSNTERVNLINALKDNSTKKRIKDEISEFGYSDDFLKSYEWARELFSKSKYQKKYITFKDLVKLTNMESLYYIYVHSSSCVHASVYNSVNGFDLPDEFKSYSYWNTRNTRNGYSLVYGDIFLLLEKTIAVMIANHEPKLANIFVLECVKRIGNTFKFD